MSCPNCKENIGTIPFIAYADRFLKLLMTKYQWSVIRAYWFDTRELADAYGKGLDVQEAYWHVFGVERDDMSPHLITPSNSKKPL